MTTYAVTLTTEVAVEYIEPPVQRPVEDMISDLIAINKDMIRKGATSVLVHETDGDLAVVGYRRKTDAEISDETKSREDMQLRQAFNIIRRITGKEVKLED